ncbi:hypothetical protein NQ318_018558 [Aromia moschata]|uniref:Uncharacterized protein n=1 Tax=Aromia moschata TaxID=1265417 RepID=A0AAV8ZIE1_9CUCU|nr:hypothetical protein NQ318_018558 [Aromia moschata]
MISCIIVRQVNFKRQKRLYRSVLSLSKALLYLLIVFLVNDDTFILCFGSGYALLLNLTKFTATRDSLIAKHLELHTSFNTHAIYKFTVTYNIALKQYSVRLRNILRIIQNEEGLIGELLSQINANQTYLKKKNSKIKSKSFKVTVDLATLLSGLTLRWDLGCMRYITS